MTNIPVIEVQHYIENNEFSLDECKKVAECLHKFGILIFRDPRIKQEFNDQYINMLEQYFSKRGELYSKGLELTEMRKDLNYQSGITREFTEKAKNHCQRFEDFEQKNKPLSECPPEYDAKWRFFWHMNEGMTDAEFKKEYP